MTDKDQDHPPVYEPQAAFSSPPCFAHEVDQAYLGLAPALDVAALRMLGSTLDEAIIALRSVRYP